jgi:hypothetical protein
MVESIAAIFSGAALALALYDIIIRRVDAWKLLQLQLQEQIRALKAETVRSLISQMSGKEAGRVSRELNLFLGKRLKK